VLGCSTEVIIVERITWEASNYTEGDSCARWKSSQIGLFVLEKRAELISRDKYRRQGGSHMQIIYGQNDEVSRNYGS